MSELQEHFDFLDTSHKPAIRPSTNGESLDAIHARHAYALQQMIENLDQDPSQPRAILLCTHAASMICIGRVLTGRMPEDVGEEDFRCGTCALSIFHRRSQGDAGARSISDAIKWNPTDPESIPAVDWQCGRGVAGGWDCHANGDCSFLEGGEERTW